MPDGEVLIWEIISPAIGLISIECVHVLGYSSVLSVCEIVRLEEQLSSFDLHDLSRRSNKEDVVTSSNNRRMID